MDKPLVSIVTPSFNQGSFIRETLDSVLQQDYANLELIVMDGGSHDSTLDVLRSYSDPRLQWVSEPDRGQSDAINKGLRLAKGDILTFLNSDDLLLPGAITAIVDFMKASPESSLVYGDCLYIDGESKPLELSKPRPFDLHMVLLGKTGIPQPGAFWRRSIMQEIGLFDETLHYVMDVDYWLRIALAGGTLTYLPGTRSAFRLHAQSKTVSKMPQFWDDWDQMVRKLFESPQLDPALQPIKQAALRPYNRLYSILGFWKQGERVSLRPHLLTLIRGGAPRQHRILAAIMYLDTIWGSSFTDKLLNRNSKAKLKQSQLT